MKVIVTYKNYHSIDRREILPEVFKIKGRPEDALRKIWEDDYNGAISDNLYNDLNDPIDEENCWFEEDRAMITWQDGDTKEYYVIDVEEMEEWISFWWRYTLLWCIWITRRGNEEQKRLDEIEAEYRKKKADYLKNCKGEWLRCLNILSAMIAVS